MLLQRLPSRLTLKLPYACRHLQTFAKELGPERQRSSTPPFPTFEASQVPMTRRLSFVYFISGGGNFSNIFLTALLIVFAFFSGSLLTVSVAVPRQMYLFAAASPISTIK